MSTLENMIKVRENVLNSLVGKEVYLIKPGQYGCCGKKDVLQKQTDKFFHGEDEIIPRKVLTIHEFDTTSFRIGLFDGNLEGLRQFDGPNGVVNVDPEASVDEERDAVTRNLLGEIEVVAKNFKTGKGFWYAFTLTYKE